MTTTEKNKLIAEFMEGKGSSNIYYLPQFGKYISSYGKIEYEDTFCTEELKYHSSYDWIMPVVERIEDMGYLVDIFTKAVSIHLNDGETIVYLNGNNYISKLEAIYNAVVEFIMWYNLNKGEK